MITYGTEEPTMPNPEQAHREAQRALRGTDTATLLTKAYALTHRMHSEPNSSARHADLRAQRDLITAEVERRTRLHDLPLPHPDLPGLTHAKRERIVGAS